MRITWKDGVTTLATAGAVVLERAYFHNWDWPLISNMRWVIIGLAVLIATSLVFSYALDEDRSIGWSAAAGFLGFTAAALTALGLIFTVTDYVVLLMLNAVLFWLASIVRHATVHEPITHSHA